VTAVVPRTPRIKSFFFALPDRPAFVPGQHMDVRLTAPDGYQAGEVRIPAGERVLLLYGAANRDERRFAEPDRFDVTRDARDHVAFGHGVHRCAGGHLAQQLRVRCTRLALSSAQTRWGSASADGSIRLNWRLVHFGLPVIDYVVTHELAHLREMNHGPRFWAVVGSVVPDYRAARRQPRCLSGRTLIPTTLRDSLRSRRARLRAQSPRRRRRVGRHW